MKTIGNYQILAEIGVSASGKTYRVRDTFRKIELALKALEFTSTVSAELREEFCRDLTACGALQHPHLVRTHDVGEAGGTLYVVTDLLAGASLRAYLEDHRVIPMARKLELIAQACDGIAAAHSRGIAHGNIKPSNIFIAGPDAQVLDLATGRWLCLILTAGARPENLLPNYFAPEQILGKPFDARSDVYSIALVLYEWLAGKYPFQVAASILPREIVHTALEPLQKVAPELPDALHDLVARASHKDPEQRLQTAAEFAQGLYGIIRDLEAERAKVAFPLPVVAPPPPVPTPPPPSVAVHLSTTVGPAVVQPAPSGSLGKRLMVYSLAAVIALSAVVMLLSRQGIDASQNKGPVVRRIETVTPANSVTQTKPVEQQPAPVATPAPAPAPATATPAAVPDEAALLVQINSAFQSGAYPRAMRLVNQILADDPGSPEARTWKKKIRAAQDAEEAMK
jgi:serine/threonine protein kinase